MNTIFPRPTKRRWIALAVVLAIGACAATAYSYRDWWLPAIGNALAVSDDGQGDPGAEKRAAADAAACSGDDAAVSLRLSEQARKNIDLKVLTIEPRDYHRTVSMPALVVERPGRTRIKVSAPMTGIVTRIYPIRGEAVIPGEPLFDLRLTHEDLVTSQSELLQTVEQLDVIEKEVDRLREVTRSGAVAGKRLLERQYEQRKTEALLHAQKEGLILHGLTPAQVDAISSQRKLLRSLTVFAPEPAEKLKDQTAPLFLQVSKVEVEQGQQVTSGEPLCVLANHAELYIEGKAFEEDAEELNEAAVDGVPVTAVVQGNGKGPHSITDLKILYVESEIELASRALRFYVRLPNSLVRNEPAAVGHRFIAWRYRPGQRVEVFVPVEKLGNRIVLPVDAVVKEGAEWFVFQQQGDHFVRRPVHVEHRDQARREVVIENDGTLFPGDVVASTGAFQIHLAVKNQTGGAVDPHAGHNH